MEERMSSSERKAPWEPDAPPQPRAYDAGYGAGFCDGLRKLLDPPKGSDPLSGNEEFNRGYIDGWQHGNAQAPEHGRPPNPFDPMA